MGEKRKTFTEASRLEFRNTQEHRHNLNHFERHSVENLLTERCNSNIKHTENKVTSTVHVRLARIWQQFENKPISSEIRFTKELT